MWISSSPPGIFSMQVSMPSSTVNRPISCFLRNPDSVSGQIWNRYGDCTARIGRGDKRSGSGPGNGHRLVRWIGLQTRIPCRVSRPRRLAQFGCWQREYGGLGRPIARISGNWKFYRDRLVHSANFLDRAIAQKLKSVAFPLIGCGRFGLDEMLFSIPRRYRGVR